MQRSHNISFLYEVSVINLLQNRGPGLRKRVQKQTQTEMMATPDHVGEPCVSPSVPDTAERSQQYLAGMIANTSDAIIALDEHFHLLELNPAAEQVLGVAASEVVGHECSEVLRCQNLNRMKLCGTSSCPLHRVLQQKK